MEAYRYCEMLYSFIAGPAVHVTVQARPLARDLWAEEVVSHKDRVSRIIRRMIETRVSILEDIFKWLALQC